MLRNFHRCLSTSHQLAANCEASRALVKFYQMHGHGVAKNVNPLGNLSEAISTGASVKQRDILAQNQLKSP